MIIREGFKVEEVWKFPHFPNKNIVHLIFIVLCRL